MKRMENDWSACAAVFGYEAVADICSIAVAPKHKAINSKSVKIDENTRIGK